MQRGELTAHVASNQVQLARFQSLVKDRPGLRGILNLDAGVTAEVSRPAAETEIQLTALNANMAAHDLEIEKGKPTGRFHGGRLYGRLNPSLQRRFQLRRIEHQGKWAILTYGRSPD